ncbi:MAG: response regulator transcription factor [Anaerolineae bacterium]|nr:response regulator transcription factor [Anaerolineae bacterium]
MTTLARPNTSPALPLAATPRTILIVDDDLHLTDVIRLYLERKGYRVVTAADGEEGLACFNAGQPNLILLDVMLPKLNGYEVCRRLRDVSNVPIIFLSARGQDTDRVTGLRLGADDYVSKPFSLRELEARIESVLRRAQSGPAPTGLMYRDPYLVIDAWGWRVTCEGHVIDLTAVERHLLLDLVMGRGQTRSVDHLLSTVWANNEDRQMEYVKLYIRRLRQKIEPNPDEPRYILTQRGRGYRFAGFEMAAASSNGLQTEV